MPAAPDRRPSFSPDRSPAGAAASRNTPIASGSSTLTVSLRGDAIRAHRRPIMAEIVAAALASHAPLITGKPEIARPEQRERLYASFHELRRRLAAARPDLLVMFVNDHLQNFPYSNLPAFCVGIVDAYDAPSAGGSKLMRISPRKIRGLPQWSMALLEAGLAGGFDFAYSYEIESWDELAVPLHFLDPDGTIPVATVYTNCAAPPLPSLRRCHEMGAFVGRFARAHAGAARSEEHTSELQSPCNLVCRLLLEKKKKKIIILSFVKKKKQKKNHI